MHNKGKSNEDLTTRNIFSFFKKTYHFMKQLSTPFNEIIKI